MDAPHPPPMLAVILGASHYPEAPKLTAGRPFLMSAADVEEYVRSEDRGLAVPTDNILYLFDDSRSGGDQVSAIGRFLSKKCPRIADKDGGPEDLLVYYVGHGLFTRGDEHAYCLAVRSTEEINVGGTSIRATDLASTIKENAPFLRRYLILDCCFSARAYSEFMGAPLTAASVQLRDELPPSGTALLCSSSARDVSLAPAGRSHTMFTGALLKALKRGDRRCGPRLSLSDLGALVKGHLEEEYGEERKRPEVHSPDQRKGDIATLPLFPNPACESSTAAVKSAEEEQLAREAVAAKQAAAEIVERERRAREAAKAAKKAEEERPAHERAERKAAAARQAATEIVGRERRAREAAKAAKEEEEERLAHERAERKAAAAKQAAVELAEREDRAREAADAARRAEEERLAREKAEAEEAAAKQAAAEIADRENRAREAADAAKRTEEHEWLARAEAARKQADRGNGSRPQAPPHAHAPKIAPREAPTAKLKQPEPQRTQGLAPQAVPVGSGGSLLRTRAVAAVGGGVVGIVILVITMSIDGGSHSDSVAEVALFYGFLPWAIVGAIAGQRRNMIVSTLASAVLGNIVVWIVYAGEYHEAWFSRAAIFGGEPGAFLGAIAGVIYQRYRLKKGSRAHRDPLRNNLITG